MKATNKKETDMPSITPSLWFDHNLEERRRSTPQCFRTRTSRASTGLPTRAPASPARSCPAASCEVDYYWDRLTDGGEESQCGWCKDRFGLSWQIVPDRLYELVSHPDPARAAAATQARYGMRKIVIADLEDAVAAV